MTIQLIADSGSTKTSWALLQNQQAPQFFETIGFNPFLMDADTIAQAVQEQLQENPAFPLSNQQTLNIQYYGAGCSTLEKKELVSRALLQVFPNAAILVDHDLLAAARALCGNQPGLAAILGTGSNTCFFDGAHIQHNVPSLGFILGDEGSGAYLGKLFIQKLLNEELPFDLSEDFLNSYQLSKEKILNAVYKQAMPNRFLASFSHYLKIHLHHPAIEALVLHNFQRFFEQHILKYPQAHIYPLHCVGSIAHHFQPHLQQVAKGYGITLGHILQNPIQGLITYHQSIAL